MGDNDRLAEAFKDGQKARTEKEEVIKFFKTIIF